MARIRWQKGIDDRTFSSLFRMALRIDCIFCRIFVVLILFPVDKLDEVGVRFIGSLLLLAEAGVWRVDARKEDMMDSRLLRQYFPIL